MPVTTRSSGTPIRRLRPMVVTSSMAARKALLGDTFVDQRQRDRRDLQHLHPGGLACRCWQRSAQLQRRHRDRCYPQRHGLSPTSIAELSEIEEIRINSVDPSGPAGRRRRRHLQHHRRLLGHQPSPQHHHHRWRCGRRHDRHLGAEVGPPDRLQVEWRQRHDHRRPSVRRT